MSPKSVWRAWVTALLSLALAVSAQPVWAVPPLPGSFYGTVAVDGANPPAGTLVSAWVNGVQVSAVPIDMAAGLAVYHLNVPGDDLDTVGVEGARPGESVTFRIGSLPAAQFSVWQSGSNTRLDLTAATPTPTPLPSATPTATATFTSTPSPTPCPGASGLDAFNRANGALGTNWSGSTATTYYTIATNRVDVVNGGPLYWLPTSFGVNQEVFVTLAAVDPLGAEQDLLLKVQGTSPNWSQGVIEVLFDAPAGTVHVETYRSGAGWTVYPASPATFAAGDRFGARALANGTVEIYRNCTRLAVTTLAAADQTFFNPKGGRIGLWFVSASSAFLDDFGGGTFTP